MLILKIRSILAVTNLLAHNNISEIILLLRWNFIKECYGNLTSLEVTFILFCWRWYMKLPKWGIIIWETISIHFFFKYKKYILYIFSTCIRTLKKKWEIFEFTTITEHWKKKWVISASDSFFLSQNDSIFSFSEVQWRAFSGNLHRNVLVCRLYIHIFNYVIN